MWERLSGKIFEALPTESKTMFTWALPIYNNFGAREKFPKERKTMRCVFFLLQIKYTLKPNPMFLLSCFFSLSVDLIALIKNRHTFSFINKETQPNQKFSPKRYIFFSALSNFGISSPTTRAVFDDSI